MISLPPCLSCLVRSAMLAMHMMGGASSGPSSPLCCFVNTTDHKQLTFHHRTQLGRDLLHIVSYCVQAYSPLKRAEHALKSVKYDGKAISVVEPNLYAKRFTDFMRQQVFCPGAACEQDEAVSL
jgi:hypothetical protein